MPKPPPSSRAEKPQTPGTPQTTRPRLLLLEDDGSMAVPLMEHLQENDFDVTLATSGVDGLKEVMARDYDVILCDMLMPHLPGDMFYLAVERTKPKLCKRFIFMTGHQADPRWDNFVRKVGGVMLYKPFQFHEMMERIQMILRKAAQK